MLTDALKKVNESAPRDTNGNKQGVVLKYVIVPTGLGLVDDEKLHGGFVNRARIIEKYKSRCLQPRLCAGGLPFVHTTAA